MHALKLCCPFTVSQLCINHNTAHCVRVQAVSQEDGTDLDPTNAQAGGPRGGGGAPGAFRGPVSDVPPDLGSVQRASIRSIKPYGVFVQMEGFRSNALVHLSQVPPARSALHHSFTNLSCHDLFVHVFGAFDYSKMPDIEMPCCCQGVLHWPLCYPLVLFVMQSGQTHPA